jgi:hypothetical protein
LFGCEYCQNEICKICAESWDTKLCCKGCYHIRYIEALDEFANKKSWSIERDIARKSCKKCPDCKKWNYQNIAKCQCFISKDLKRVSDINKLYNNDHK